MGHAYRTDLGFICPAWRISSIYSSHLICATCVGTTPDTRFGGKRGVNCRCSISWVKQQWGASYSAGMCQSANTGTVPDTDTIEIPVYQLHYVLYSGFQRAKRFHRQYTRHRHCSTGTIRDPPLLCCTRNTLNKGCCKVECVYLLSLTQTRAIIR